MTQKTLQSVGNFNQPSPQPQQHNTQQTPEPNMNQPQQPQMPDPDLQLTNPQEYNRQLQQYIAAMQQQQLQQYSQPFVQSAADTALHLSKNGKYKNVWDRWEPEIMAELNNIPRQHWNVTLLDKAAQLVRANHLDEIVREEAERMASQRPSAPAVEGTEPSGLPSQGSDNGPLAEMFEENHPAIQRLKKANLTLSDIRARLGKMNVTEEEYAESLKKSNIIAEDTYSQVEAGGYN